MSSVLLLADAFETWVPIVAVAVTLLIFGLIGFAILKSYRWFEAKAMAARARLFEDVPLAEWPEPGFVYVAFHTYSGILLFVTQIEHQFWAEPDNARLLLSRLHRFNLTWGFLVAGPLIPIMSLLNYGLQRRSITRQIKQAVSMPPRSAAPEKTNPANDEEGEREQEEWYARKSAIMEEMLGKEHDMVMHAIIPYALGGGLDLYYYPNDIPGTAIATKELSDHPGEGSSNSVFECYELVMFTKLPLKLDDALNEEKAFGKMHSVMNSILNGVAPYSAQATLNPNETCEFPPDMPKIGGRCLIFDGYPSYPDEEEPAEFGLLAVIEVFRSEMEFAREAGGAMLIERLKANGHYPYSDLDREPVV